MILKKIRSSIVFIFLFAGLTSFSQHYKVKNYNIQDGICHPFVYTLNQDTRGYLWAGTGEGLCRFNGFDFSQAAVNDSLSGQVAVISFKDADGNLLFGFNNGALIRYDGKTFETASPIVNIKSSITGIVQLAGKDYLLATLNDGLILLNQDLSGGNQIEGLQEMMLTALWSDGKIILTGSPDGLTIYELTSPGKPLMLVSSVEELSFHKIQDIRQSLDKKALWIATEDAGAYRLTLTGKSYSIQPVGEKFGLHNKNIQSVFEDSEKNLWLSSLHKGLYKLTDQDQQGLFATMDHLDKTNGLPGNAIKDVLEDAEGNIWIATYGEGLVQMLSQAFSFYTFNIPGIDNNISAILSFNGSVWIGGNGTVARTDPEKKVSPVIYNRRNGVPQDKITALTGYQGNLYIGTEASGLYKTNIQNGVTQKIHYSDNSLGNTVQSLTIADETIYLATRDGVYTVDIKTGEVANYSTLNGLPHNDIKHILVTADNRLLFATRTNGIYEINENGEVLLAYPAGRIEQEFNVIAQDASGNIWASTYGDGVYRFSSDTVMNFTAANGLKSNYCYCLIPGHRSIWIGHRLGISRINTEHFTTQVYDVTKGITGDCNFNATGINNTDIVYFGTTEGMISYDPSMEKDSPVPPFTNITKLLISDKEYDFNQDIVLPYALYKLRIEFIGLSYSDPAAVKYQYKLEGHDLEWSEITSLNVVTYPRIEDGDYTFLLRSFDSNGLSQETPVSFHIRVKLPFWKTWWFYTLCGLALLLSVIAIIKYRERKQKELQEYLETELAARTKEVVEQKEEIELKNRDITDSITYAQRIQASILPPVKRLKQNFSGSFVFYQPRDIVSGDFYWFDKVNENKFIIVCADSTGHGVPGAFMSMIGTTLIKDICFREAGKAPSEILKVLDTELGNTLNQNLEDGTKPPDGMDIIVCEIDLKTNYMRYAAAMRPLVVYKDGEQIYLKGSHSSVGGVYDREGKSFQDEGLQLTQGDIIYMFSDGYPDQFGGTMGKKFKMVRLKNMLVDIYQKPMDEQYVHVKNTFKLWKENYEQVDDVLFMGIKI